MTPPAYRVRAVHCDHRADSSEIERAIRRATDPLAATWERLARARKVVVKFNMMKRREAIHYHAGRRRELVDDPVAHAVLRLLRERTSARLVATDTFPYGNGARVPDDHNYQSLLRQYDVEFVDSSLPPFADHRVPGGGCMFGQYRLNAVFADADEVVSVAKLKNHAFMGVTLTTKNLFGLPPMIPPDGRTRSYYHHLIRLSYVLSDLAMIARPCLNIIEALVGQSGREWGGEGRVTDALVAGDHPIATDACGTWLMGHSPEADWPAPPFRRDRNHLLIAAQRGFGTVDLRQIDFTSEVAAPLAAFDSDATDPGEMVDSWRRTACEQALFYERHRDEFVDRYAGEFIYLQDGEVVWHGPDPTNLASRRQLSGDRRHSALWLKLVDPEEREAERFGAYRECLDLMRA